jgi:hypothetical protein
MTLLLDLRHQVLRLLEEARKDKSASVPSYPRPVNVRSSVLFRRIGSGNEARVIVSAPAGQLETVLKTHGRYLPPVP